MENAFCATAPGQGPGCTGWMASNVNLVLSKGAWGVPAETLPFPDISFSKTTARWDGDDCGEAVRFIFPVPKEMEALCYEEQVLGSSCQG